MPAKTPIYLKAANSKKGKKCKLRDILSPDLISPPLGDFRHTIHIGKGGEQDAFGDMSFLQGKYDLLPGKEEQVSPQYVACNEFFRANSTCDATFAETPSPVLKNAISLPTIGGSQALTLPLLSAVTFPTNPEPLDPVIEPALGSEETQRNSFLLSMDIFNPKPSPTKKTTKKSILSFDMPKEIEKKKQFENGKIHMNDNGFKNSTPGYVNGNGKLHHSTNFTGHYNDWLKGNSVEDNLICDYELELMKGKSILEESMSDMTGSLLSLELDLGPSILDEVLNVMDKPKM
ncbi:cdc42 effector protein 3 [Amia ocellicauda]|uniref:cdc42 effector protein 3 n=1 Tax=Amia ocellicauda TaxID=2972642 RepID=UPI0034640BE4